MNIFFALILGFIAGFTVCWIYRDRLKAKADAVIGVVEK